MCWSFFYSLYTSAFQTWPGPYAKLIAVWKIYSRKEGSNELSVLNVWNSSVSKYRTYLRFCGSCFRLFELKSHVVHAPLTRNTNHTNTRHDIIRDISIISNKRPHILYFSDGLSVKFILPSLTASTAYYWLITRIF